MKQHQDFPGCLPLQHGTESCFTKLDAFFSNWTKTYFPSFELEFNLQGHFSNEVNFFELERISSIVGALSEPDRVLVSELEHGSGILSP